MATLKNSSNKSCLFLVSNYMVDIINGNTMKFWKSQLDFNDTVRQVRHHKRHVTLIAVTSHCAPGKSPGVL